MPIAFRESRESDMNFIYATLLKSYRYSNPIAKAEKDHDYYRRGSHQWQRAFHDGAKALVACDEEDPELIIGFIVYGDRMLHFTYVKAAFRSAGIAKSLLAEAKLESPLDYSHWTLDILRLGLDEKFDLHYNPYLFNWE